ncbi:MAG: hypothetical protein ACM3JF_00345 [Sphaerimonospora mesophila]
MRIAFLGKGGSGKTTVSSLVARLAPESFDEIYVIDSDINKHMKSALGLSDQQVHPFTPVFNAFESKVRQYHPALNGLTALPRTLPVWDTSVITKISFDEEPFSGNQPINNTLVYELGSYNADTMGWSCHHNALGKLQFVLTHAVDTSEQLIIADLTAGADVFGVGILGLFDKVYVVVEPTIKSTDIFLQLKELAGHDDVELEPIANKVMDETDLAFIADRIGQLPGYTVKLSNFVRRLERGETVTTNDIETENYQTVEQLLHDVANIRRNNREMYEHIMKNHRRAAKNWPKGKFGDVDLLTLINPDYEPIA